jgi:hypothetical protein
MVMAGTDTVAPGVTVAVACCVAVPLAMIGAEGAGDPLGLTVPDAAIVLPGVSVAVAVAVSAGVCEAVPVGGRTSHVTVTAAFGEIPPAGALSSIANQ